MNRTLLLTAAALSLSIGAQTPTPAAPAKQATPVLIELFTSEGCSDCPPADAVLTSLEGTQPLPGVQIIALGEHVTYWNNRRWADRFSSAAFTTRQNEYAASFHNSQVYTPQLVVDGQTEFVGSDRSAALSAITRAARQPRADVQIAQTGGSVTVSVSRLPAGARDAQVWLAVTEDGLQSQVRGGENAGRHLTHNAVVRTIRLLGLARNGAQFTAPVPAGGSKSAVAFVQETGSRHVLGAARAQL